jgi:NADH-quinone oxidoreductase subunit L
MNGIEVITLALVFSPLAGALVAGLGAKKIGERGAHLITTLLVLCSFYAACTLVDLVYFKKLGHIDITLYKWLQTGYSSFQVGFLIDRLSVLMAFIVTLVSLLVHIYSIGYMQGDKGYQRFFSYVSLFTFAMLALVMSNNLVQLFFGWEGVGVVSYLLIGFWYHKESAAAGSLKAFLVNRVGDFGFILGLAVLYTIIGSLDYSVIFMKMNIVKAYAIEIYPFGGIPINDAICFCFLIGAMGKSAQIPLHVWLPESMEGPTPISALIHAATMVTAGIYLITRMSPLFESSPAVLNIVLLIGSSGALLLGLVGIVQNDIKRVVAYSTLSQLGYMIAATGASAYSAGMFHLVTHAFFKALLFLGAGSVIVALHHEQDMRMMGGLWRKMPITFFTFLIGTLALAAIPPFSGFFSKDAIIEAVSLSKLPASSWAYFCLVAGAYVTSLYSFRALFMTFFGKCKYTKGDIKESPFTICMPLIILAVGSICSGYLLAPEIMNPRTGYLASTIFLSPDSRHMMTEVIAPYSKGPEMILDAFHHLPFWLTILGFLTAYYSYVVNKDFPTVVSTKFNIFYRILLAKFGFDSFNDWFFIRGFKALSNFFYNFGDQKVIDQTIVQGTAKEVVGFAKVLRLIQTGYLYHYTMVMVLGVALFISFTLFI